MAKITLGKLVIEGSIEELKQMGVKFPFEEAEAETKWAKIGRKPNEFKKGDIVRIDDPCGAPLSVGQTVEVKYDSNSKSSVNVTEKGWAVTVSELITPVEARFDR